MYLLFLSCHGSIFLLCSKAILLRHLLICAFSCLICQSVIRTQFLQVVPLCFLKIGSAASYHSICLCEYKPFIFVVLLHLFTYNIGQYGWFFSYNNGSYRNFVCLVRLMKGRSIEGPSAVWKDGYLQVIILNILIILSGERRSEY